MGKYKSPSLAKPTRPGTNKPGKPNLDKPDRTPDEPEDREWPEFPEFAEVQESLVPWGGGFYGPSNDPIDPYDCDRWPNSIYCSGALSSDWQDIAGIRDSFSPGDVVGGEITPILTRCDIGVSYQPSFLFLQGPELQFLWRRPECRLPDVEDGLGDIFDDLPLPDPPIAWTPSQTPMTLAVALGDAKFGGVVDVKIRWNGELRVFPFVRFVRQVYGEQREEFYNPIRVVNQSNFTIDLIQAHENNQWGYEVTGLAGNIQTVRLFMFWLGDNINNPSDVSHSTSGQHYGGWNRATTKHYGRYTSNGTAILNTPYAEEIQINEWPLFDYWNQFTPDRYRLFNWTTEGIPRPRKTPPPPVPPNFLPIEPMPKCCCSGNDDLLRALMHEVQQLREQVGEFPIETISYHKPKPKEGGYKRKKVTLTSIAGFLKEIFNRSDRVYAITDAQRMIDGGYKLPRRLIEPTKANDKSVRTFDTLPKLLEYVTRQIDRAVGTLPMKIRVADGDPTKKGNQKVEVECHSLTSLMKETLEIGIENRGDIDAANLMLVRALFELGLIHQGSIQNYYMLDALIDWADFKVKYISKKFPFSFNPLAGQNQKKKGFDQQRQGQRGDVPDNEKELEKILVQLLEEKMLSVKVIINDDKKKTQADFLREILKYAQLAAEAVTEPATGKQLDLLIDRARMMLKMDGLLNRSNTIQAITTGDFTKNK